MRDISDHSSVNLKLHLDTRSKMTTWRLNVSMLTSPEFKEKIKKELKTYLDYNDDGNVNPVMLWDTAKAVLRETETANRTGTTT